MGSEKMRDPALIVGDVAGLVAKLETQAAKIATLRSAVIDARRQFRDYALQHDAKGTPEAAVKAQVNRDFATMLTLALHPEDRP
jgi:hypothetical protein